MSIPQQLSDGDASFVGVNNRLDPSQLPPGYVSDAANVRFSSGVAETRKGIRLMRFGNINNTGVEVTSTHTSTWTSGNATITDTSTVKKSSDIGFYPYNDVKGVGKFRDPNGANWLLIATKDKAYGILEASMSGGTREIKDSSDSSVTNSNPVVFVQCFNNVVMFRGDDVTPLVLKDIDDGWESIQQEDNEEELDENEKDGTEVIPNASTGLFFQNRLMIPHKRDLVAVSDYLNYTRYQPVMANFRINKGSEDELVALWKYDENTLLCFKQASVYAVRNLVGNLTDAYLDEITRDYGVVSDKAIATVGRDIWFLSDQRGVVSLSLSQSGKMQGQDIPISDPIKGYIDRINWNYASKAVAMYHGNRFYLAVPLDSSTVNSAIIVYDFRNQAWSGIDTSAAITGLKDFVTYTYQGAKRLFFVTDKFLYLYDDNTFCSDTDDVVATGTDGSGNFTPSDANGRNTTPNNVASQITTRGYKCNTEQRKQFRELAVDFKTNNVVLGSISATGITDGVKEETILFNKSFSRTKYTRPFDKDDYVITNAGDDYLVPYREDYSLALGSSDSILPKTNGFDPDLRQESKHKTAFTKEGRHIRFKISCSSGSMEITTLATAGGFSNLTHPDKR